MWIFSKIYRKAVNKIIAAEVQVRRYEIQDNVVELDRVYSATKKDYEFEFSKLESLKGKVDIELVALETARLRIEAEQKDLRIRLDELYQKADVEQKKLWDKLDILRDNLNTENVLMELWQSAYSKAVDSVWPLLQKEMLHLVELAEHRAYSRAKAEFDQDIANKFAYYSKLEKNGDMIPAVKITAIKQDLEDKKLVAERTNNDSSKILLAKYIAQLEILEAL